MESGYCTIMWNGRDHRASEMNTTNHAKGWFSSKEGDIVKMVGLKRCPLL